MRIGDSSVVEFILSNIEGLPQKDKSNKLSAVDNLKSLLKPNDTSILTENRE